MSVASSTCCSPTMTAAPRRSAFFTVSHSADSTSDLTWRCLSSVDCCGWSSTVCCRPSVILDRSKIHGSSDAALVCLSWVALGSGSLAAGTDDCVSVPSDEPVVSVPLSPLPSGSSSLSPLLNPGMLASPAPPALVHPVLRARPQPRRTERCDRTGQVSQSRSPGSSPGVLGRTCMPNTAVSSSFR